MDQGAWYQHYAGIIESLLPPGGPAFEPVAEDETAVQVERGVVLPMAVAGAEPGRIAAVMDRLLSPGSSKLRVVDAAGHVRPPYPGLLVYAWWRALAVVSRDLPGAEARAGSPALGAWCKRLAGSVERTRLTCVAGSLSPADAAAALSDSAWAAMASRAPAALHFTFPGIFEMQQASGAFFPSVRSSNPEPMWYHELVLLHAVAAYAINQDDAPAREAALRNAVYHLHETQPDHATNEPWGLLAFVLNPDARSLADQLLHTVRVQHPGGARGVTAILLADVLVHLRELARRPG